MKLVEILARELEEWPEPNGHAWQDYSKEIRFNRTIESDFYVDQMCDDHIREINHPNPKTGVTREMWEAERARIKGEKAMPKPNKDGWIRHRGGKCPVGDDVRVDIRVRGGVIWQNQHPTNDVNWQHHGDDIDVMMWRPHKPEQPSLSSVAADGELWSDAKEMPAAKYFDGPIQWRDRIREIDAAIAAMTDERASLVAKLKAEGFALIQSDEPNGVVESAQDDIAQQDMSNPANWMVGDLIAVIDPEDSGLRAGDMAKIIEMDSGSDDDMPCKLEGAKTWLWLEHMKWHSRPTN